MRLSRMEMFRRAIGGELDQGFRLSGIDRRSLSDRSGIGYKNLCRKVHDPCELKLGELHKIAEAMGLQLNITLGEKTK